MFMTHIGSSNDEVQLTFSVLKWITPTAHIAHSCFGIIIITREMFLKYCYSPLHMSCDIFCSVVSVELQEQSNDGHQI